jgi:hypothetical protein
MVPGANEKESADGIRILDSDAPPVFHHFLAGPAERDEVEVLLALKVTVDRGLTDAGRRSDVGCTRGRVPVAREHLDSDVEDLDAAFFSG